MRTLEEQVVIITGAARGIGKFIANSVAKAGGHAIVTDILDREAEETAAAIRALGARQPRYGSTSPARSRRKKQPRL